MRLVVYDGVRYLLTSYTEEALQELHRQLPQIRADIRGMRDSQSGEQKWFHRQDSWDIKEAFGTTTVSVFSGSKPGGKRKDVLPQEHIVTKYIPAIEVYDLNEVFAGILLCHSGTFEPPYEFITVGETSLDPFLWGQWQLYFASCPFTLPRENKVLFASSTKLVEEVPCTNDTLAYWDFGDAETTEDGQYTDGPSYDYWRAIIPGAYWLCCTWSRAESWKYYYDYSSVTEGQLKLINYDPWYFTGDAIEGGSITYDYTRRFDGTFTHDISETWCYAPPDWGLIEIGCAVAEAAVRAAPSRGPTYDGVTPVSIRYYPEDVSQFGSGSINDEQIGFVDWLEEGSTAYQSDKFGGTVGAMTTGGDVQYDSRTNGIYVVDEETRVISGTAVCMATYGVSSTTYADTRIWIEGALVDGTFYEYRQGAGYYYYGYWADVPDAIKFDVDGCAHPRYWGSSVISVPIFMSSGFRGDDSSWAYFHVKVNEVLTGTEFAFDHENINGIFHTIPNFPEFYGKGYFRLVKVTEKFFSELDLGEFD